MKLKTKIAVILIGTVSIAWSLMLTYQILLLIHATELMWFLFWTNIPMAIVASALAKIVES